MFISINLVIIPGRARSIFARLISSLVPTGHKNYESASFLVLCKWNVLEMWSTISRDLFEMWWISFPSSALSTRRAKLLEVLGDPNAELQVMEETSRQYLSLLHGFIWAPGSSVPESKLRYALRFSWSNSMSALGVEHMVVYAHSPPSFHVLHSTSWIYATFVIIRWLHCIWSSCEARSRMLYSSTCRCISPSLSGIPSVPRAFLGSKRMRRSSANLFIVELVILLSSYHVLLTYLYAR